MRRLSLATLTVTMTSLVGPSFAQNAAEPAPKTNPDAAPAIGYSLRVGIEIGARSFVYSDPLAIATNLRPYDVSGVPLLALGGDIRPFVWSHVPVLDHLEIGFDYAFAPSLTSSTRDGEGDIRTTWDHGDLALRVPVRLGKHAHAPVAAATIGYGWLGFSFAETGSLATEIPTVTYRFVRIGASGEVLLSNRLSLDAAFDYLAPISGGSVYERFRDPTIDGIEARLGLGFDISKDTRVLLSFDYTRFFSSFVPIPDDAYVAGGALDQFGSVKIGIEYGR